MLCFIEAYRVLKKWEKTLDYVSCFPRHFFRAVPLPACFTTEQSTVEASLFVRYFSMGSFMENIFDPISSKNKKM